MSDQPPYQPRRPYQPQRPYQPPQPPPYQQQPYQPQYHQPPYQPPQAQYQQAQYPQQPYQPHYQQQPPQQQPYQQFQPAPPTPPAKKPFFQRVSTWVGAVVIVVVIGALAGGGGGTPATPSPARTTAAATSSTTTGTPTTAPTPAATTPAAEQPAGLPGINTAVRSGNLEATITTVEKGLEKIGQDPLSIEPKGQFIVVSLTVKNVGDKAELVSTNQVKLKSGGQQFDSDAGSAVYLGKEAFLFEQLNPGTTLKGKVVFDVPDGFTLDTLEFSGSFRETPAVVDVKG